MPSIFIFHGIYGSPEENWFPWLKNKLEAKGCTVHVPHFPTHENLKPEDWWKTFEPYAKFIAHDSIFVGHSLGCAFALSVIEKYSVKAGFFVAPAFGKTENEFTPIMASIADQAFDWRTIRTHCDQFRIFHAHDDPYLPSTKAEELAAHLHTRVVWVKEAGHFNAAAGFMQFPLLLDEIDASLS